MDETRTAYLSDLTEALADAKDQLKSTTSLLESRGERSKAEELAGIEATLVGAEITIAKKFSAISEPGSRLNGKAA